MKSRPKGRALVYERRSHDGQEASLRQQFDWATDTAAKVGVPFRGTFADILDMQQQRLHHRHDIYLDDAVTGGDMRRPGFQKFLHDAIADRSVSHVYVFKRDRLARPQDILEMMQLEKQLIASGVTLVTHERTITPEEIKTNEMVYLLSGLIEYQEHGRFSPRLGDRIVFVQKSMASKGWSTGGRAPYGFGRALVDGNDTFVRWLDDGEKVRREGHHVRFLPKDEEKIRIWCMILEWREGGDSPKRIAARLNQMGIPSPDAGRKRRDHGGRHTVPGKWHPNTVYDLCTNPIITGIKEYGKRSEGRYRRVGVDGPRELDERDLGQSGAPKLLENPLEVRVQAESGGEVVFDPERWQALQPTRMSVEEGRRKAGQQPCKPDRYPLSTRIVDLTEGCGSVMHGRKSGERLTYLCGRHVNTDRTECHHNSVDADACAAMLIDVLVALVTKAGGREAIRSRLQERAQAEAAAEAAPQEPPALALLRARLLQLEDDIATAERRMATEKNDARYAAIAKAFDALTADKEAVSREIALLEAPAAEVAARNPEEEVDELMAAIDDLAVIASDRGALQRLRPLVLKLGVYIGLDFEERMWGKRPVRKLRRGVIAFGEENLPVPIHGRSRVPETGASRVSDAAGDGGAIEQDPTLACCQGPCGEVRLFGGKGPENHRTDQSDSGSEPTRTGTNVGATGLEPATS